jgi:hypothetical protein
MIFVFFVPVVALFGVGLLGGPQFVFQHLI